MRIFRPPGGAESGFPERYAMYRSRDFSRVGARNAEKRQCDACRAVIATGRRFADPSRQRRKRYRGFHSPASAPGYNARARMAGSCHDARKKSMANGKR